MTALHYNITTLCYISLQNYVKTGHVHNSQTWSVDSVTFFFCTTVINLLSVSDQKTKLKLCPSIHLFCRQLSTFFGRLTFFSLPNISMTRGCIARKTRCKMIFISWPVDLFFSSRLTVALCRTGFVSCARFDSKVRQKFCIAAFPCSTLHFRITNPCNCIDFGKGRYQWHID